MTYLRRMAFLLILLSVPPQALAADGWYVTDILKFGVRSGPSNENRIIAMVASSDTIEMLQQGEEWSLVRLLDGKQGWVMQRYLSNERPIRLQYEDLERRHKELLAQAPPSLAELADLREQNVRIGEELSQAKTTLESFKRDSGDFIRFKEACDGDRVKLSEQDKQLRKLEEELSAYSHNQNIRWFLSGAAVLLVGFFMGSSARRKQRRASLL